MLPIVSLIALFVLISTLNLTEGGGDGGHHHIIIHVPYHVKKIKHTHTITKHIHHDGGDKYEVLGYTVGQPIKIEGLGGHEGQGEESHGSWGHGGGENNFGGHGGGQIHYGGQQIHYGGLGEEHGHFGGYSIPSVEHVGNELNQESFNMEEHGGGISSYGGGGGHQESSGY